MLAAIADLAFHIWWLCSTTATQFLAFFPSLLCFIAKEKRLRFGRRPAAQNRSAKLVATKYTLQPRTLKRNTTASLAVTRNQHRIRTWEKFSFNRQLSQNGRYRSPIPPIREPFKYRSGRKQETYVFPQNKLWTDSRTQAKHQKFGNFSQSQPIKMSRRPLYRFRRNWPATNSKSSEEGIFKWWH